MAGEDRMDPISYSIGAVMKTAREADKKGPLETAKWAAKIPFYAWLNLAAGSFKFRGKEYRYFCHPYNETWKNERRVEVPIVWEEVGRAYSEGKRILEVGNVLSHYYPTRHDVLDKYEQAPGVKNDDVAAFRASAPYDLIVSISTLEHVGYDESPKDESKVAKAFENLRKNLANDGRILVTFPVGYNSTIDRLALDGRGGFLEWSFLKRGKGNAWSETGREDASGAKYNSPFPLGNCVAIGIGSLGSKGQK